MLEYFCTVPNTSETNETENLEDLPEIRFMSSSSYGFIAGSLDDKPNKPSKSKKKLEQQEVSIPSDKIGKRKIKAERFEEFCAMIATVPADKTQIDKLVDDYLSVVRP